MPLELPAANVENTPHVTCAVHTKMRQGKQNAGCLPVVPTHHPDRSFDRPDARRVARDRREKGLIEDEHGKQPFVTDWRGLLVGGAGAVVRPGSTEEVSKVVRLCHEHGVAIVPQGGNTGLMGGATPWPAHTGIVLSLGRMNHVLDVDPVGYAMTVEAGCVLQTLQETAAATTASSRSALAPRAPA